MKTYEIEICAKITKTITVEAMSEDAAADAAHEIFSVLSDGHDEHYEQDTLGIVVCSCEDEMEAA